MTFKCRVRYRVPKSLEKYIGNDFDALLENYVQEDHESMDEEMQEILDMINEVIFGKPIYRAIVVDNIRESIDEFSKGCYMKNVCGKHWSTYPEGADIDWNLNEHSHGWAIEDPETGIDWMDGEGIIMLEGIVMYPGAINFERTIEEWFRWGYEVGKQESEITIEDDSYMNITRIGAGTLVGRARKNLLSKSTEQEKLKIANKFTSGKKEGKIDIDPLLLNTIRILNMKGWKTRASCQGHPALAKRTYIAFETGIVPPFIPEFMSVFKSNESNFTIETFSENLVSTSRKLEKWARSLPEKENN